MYAVTSSQMKELEGRCNQWGLDYRTLMENAGRAAAFCINETIAVADKRCIVFCGKGNNGGDGFVAARHLVELGGLVTIILVEGIPTGRLPREMFDLASQLGIEILDIDVNLNRVDDVLADVDIIVDAIYGTGFRGQLSETAAHACTLINSAIAAVFSLDLPSGVEADDANGDIACVRADFTVAFDSLKPAHIMPLTAKQCGHICLVDIGIPDELKADIEYRYAIVDDKVVLDNLKKRRPNSHKGDYGRLINIAGSESYPGAAVLSSLGALRCGVGYLQLAAVPEVGRIAAVKLNEPTHIVLRANGEGRIGVSSMDILEQHLPRATAITIGCGLGLDEDTAQLVYQVLRTAPCPVVVDADGINALAENINILNDVSVPVILTPHMGELSRLLGVPVEELEENPYDYVGRFAKKYGVILVCKGYKTFVAPGELGAFINTTGNAGLAKAGSGDLLTGMIGGLLAQGVSPAMAAVCGVYLHGKAADACAAKCSQYYMQPTDVAQELAEIFLAYDR